MSPILLYTARILLGLAIFGTFTAAISLALALIGAVRFKTQKVPQISYLPPVSLLKPVHNSEKGLRENLTSYFNLDYPSFELIFCARSLTDPAILCAQEVAKDFPSVPVRFIASGEPLWANPKTFSMSLLVEAATHDVILISDSDVRVDRGYLQQVVQPLADPKVGLVTCIFRGKSAGGFPSTLIALNQTVEFSSGVLTANLLEGMTFGLGPTLLTRKSNVEQIGGLAKMGNLLADDFWLGNKIFHTGYSVALSNAIVDHMISCKNLASGIRHQISWAKNTRRTRPAGHLGTGLTFATPFGLIGLFAALTLGHPVLGVSLLLAACVNRWTQALLIGYFTVKDPAALKFFWLYPVCDLLGFCSWLASYGGATISYRGERYRIERDGTIIRISAK